MSESTDKPAHAVSAEPFMAVDRVTQELITQQLTAAVAQLQIIANAIRQDDEATSISLVYVSTVNALALLDGALKHLPWAPVPAGGWRRSVAGPTPPPPG